MKHVFKFNRNFDLDKTIKNSSCLPGHVRSKYTSSPTMNIIPTITFHMRILDVDGFNFVITIPEPKKPPTIPISVNGPKKQSQQLKLQHLIGIRFIDFLTCYNCSISCTFMELHFKIFTHVCKICGSSQNVENST